MSALLATTSRWQPLGPATAAAGLGVLLLLAGIVLRRPDVGALGVAPLLTAAWGWARRPTGPLTVELRAAKDLVNERELTAEAVLRGEGTAVRLRASSPGTEPGEALVRLDGERRVTLTCAIARTGEHELFRVDGIGLGAAQAVSTEAVTVGPAPVLVLPGTVPLARLPLPFRLQGLTGAHTARRPGDGGEFHDVHPFTPGDRLRRIDWRASARRAATGGGQLSELYVRRTHATADATVMLVIDSRDDVGPDVATWAGGAEIRGSDASSLDIAREAAASLARAYLEGGDRVGLADLGRRRRPVAPAGGRRHLQRVVRRLALALPEASPGARRRAPQLPAGALVVVLSTFLDDEAARMALLWRRSGHRVIAVDVLPPVRQTELDARVRMAYRLVSITREDRLERLRRGGVEVVRWTRGGEASTAAVPLAALARLRHTGRHR
ncbi:DUF58 domain-containing protein [Georgenia faecalis]|uniref:DUF58 domain-containing protein n=1 Tax=Georgenia faecalis TaxID=2483799 RepID=A0ABV9D7C7_9MICO|nr:DUF58 domain-containing protein [Georgenia faecalis]